MKNQLDTLDFDPETLNDNAEFITNQTSTTLRREVEKAVQIYLEQIEDVEVTDLYQLVLNQVEEPLLKTLMNVTGNNQSKAASMLGINRGTLRKKLKDHDLL